MKMKKSIIIVSIFVSSFVNYVFAQTSPTSTEYERAAKIYDGIEYNTIAFNDLKQKWVINDPVLIREIYNRFVVRDAFRINGAKISLQVVKEKTEEIYNGTVVIDLRKRYFDDEMEFFAFTPENEMQKKDPSYLFDPIKDPFLLKEIVGDKVYEKIRSQGYYYSNITKTNYDTKSGYYYDVYLNVLEPRIMYWNTTSTGRNKYLISIFGKWGSDEVMYPGWFIGEYIIGSALTYYQSIANDQKKYLYDIRIGTAVPASVPFLGTLTKGNSPQPTGQSIYFRASGDFLKYIFDGAEGWIYSLECKYTIGEFKSSDFVVAGVDTIYSVRNYLTEKLTIRELADLGDIGILEASVGFGVSDIYRYQATKGIPKLLDLDLKKSTLARYVPNVFAEIGVYRSGGLVQHNFSIMSNLNGDRYGAIGVKANIMLSGQLGLDLRIMQAFGWNQTKQPYRTDSYIVFSPVFRINY